MIHGLADRLRPARRSASLATIQPNRSNSSTWSRWVARRAMRSGGWEDSLARFTQGMVPERGRPTGSTASGTGYLLSRDHEFGGIPLRRLTQNSEPSRWAMSGNELSYLLTRRGMFQRMSGICAAIARLMGDSPLQAAQDAGVLQVLKPRAPHFPPKATSVIHLFMNGGPSQMDLFDPKPMLDKHHGQSYFDKIAGEVENPQSAGAMRSVRQTARAVRDLLGRDAAPCRSGRRHRVDPLNAHHEPDA